MIFYTSLYAIPFHLNRSMLLTFYDDAIEYLRIQVESKVGDGFQMSELLYLS